MNPAKPVPGTTSGNDRVHLASAGSRRDLMEGRLQTLCGEIARHSIPGLSTGQKGFRCTICYARIDEYGYLRES